MERQKDRTFKLLENVIFLKKSAIFSSMEAAELRAIAAITEEHVFKEKSAIVRENELGDSLYIVKKGSVNVVKKIDDKQSIVLAELSVGDCFGEMALFDAEMRSASVYTKEECVLLCINSDDLNDLLLEYPAIAIEFIKIFVKRLRKTNQSIGKLPAGSDR
jgi:CRP-like cAMP-binding protein